MAANNEYDVEYVRNLLTEYFRDNLHVSEALIPMYLQNEDKIRRTFEYFKENNYDADSFDAEEAFVRFANV